MRYVWDPETDGDKKARKRNPRIDNENMRNRSQNLTRRRRTSFLSANYMQDSAGVSSMTFYYDPLLTEIRLGVSTGMINALDLKIDEVIEDAMSDKPTAYRPSLSVLDIIKSAIFMNADKVKKISRKDVNGKSTVIKQKNQTPKKKKSKGEKKTKESKKPKKSNKKQKEESEVDESEENVVEEIEEIEGDEESDEENGDSEDENDADDALDEDMDDGEEHSDESNSASNSHVSLSKENGEAVKLDAKQQGKKDANKSPSFMEKAQALGSRLKSIISNTKSADEDESSQKGQNGQKRKRDDSEAEVVDLGDIEVEGEESEEEQLKPSSQKKRKIGK